MSPTKSSQFETLYEQEHGDTRERLKRIEYREWLLWGAAVTITLLLTAGIASFLLPLLNSHGNEESLSALREEVVGLFGVVLLFDLYTIYQQLQLHRMRRRLLDSEEIFRLISENAADLIAVVDAEGHRIYNSGSYQRVLGYSPEELRSSSAFAQIHPDDIGRVQTAADETRRTGVGQPIEYRIRHRDGSWRVMESTSSRIGASKKSVERLVIVNRDITQRKETLEALRLSEASLRSLVEEAPYGIYRARPDGGMSEVNPALLRMLRYETREDFLRLNLGRDVFRNGEDFQKLCELMQGANDFRDMEFDWVRRDGSFITVRCGGRRLKEESGNSAGIEVFAEDVTEKRILERQLRMAGKMEAIGRLSGGIAHDFNNLLGVIIGYGQLLRRKLGPEQASLYEFAEEIQKAGERAAALTRQLLAFSRQQILSPTILDLNQLVSDMQKMLPRLIGEDIEVQVDLQSDLGTVKADRSQVEQVIMNLAVNARDAMPTGGKLLIETANTEFDETYTRNHDGAKLGHYVMLSVTDAGIGMTPEVVAQIFEPFFTTKELGKGTGLGLATVYGVVKQSGGYIWVDSTPGEGSSFKVFLPRTSEPIAVAAPPVANVPDATHRETILLVEDAEPLRKLARSILEQHGYSTLTAEHGEAALKLAAEHRKPIDLLLTDVVMPGINGRVLSERLLPQYPHMKVLYMSGYTDSFIAGHGVLEQGIALLHKPFTEEALLAKVRQVLDAPSLAAAETR